MMKRGLAPHLLLMVLSCILIIAASCSGSSVSPPSTSPAVPPSAPSPPPPAPPGAVTPATPSSGQSVDQLSQAGKTVFASSCRCHGDKGQGVNGPAIIGPNANLGKYATAKALLTFISTIMPASAPGSLPSQSYLQLLAFLLVENKIVAPGTTMNPAQLDTIKLSK